MKSLISCFKKKSSFEKKKIALTKDTHQQKASLLKRPWKWWSHKFELQTTTKVNKIANIL